MTPHDLCVLGMCGLFNWYSGADTVYSGTTAHSGRLLIWTTSVLKRAAGGSLWPKRTEGRRGSRR